MDRRSFFSLALLPGLHKLTKSIDSLKIEESKNSEFETNKIIASKILPPRPEKNSTIAITAPASPTSEWEIRSTIRAMKKLGYKVEVGKTIYNKVNKYKYFSAPDEERANEFMEYIERKDVSMILCGRGGYGSMRILNLIDYDSIKNNPKIIIGFSDITALLIGIYIKTGLVCFHGPVAVSTFEDTIVENISNLIVNNHLNHFSISNPRFEVIVPGKAQGNLIGGNLTMLTSTLGTPFEIETDNSILFIEEISEHPYKIDRMITQLLLAGKLQKCNGIVIGYIKGANAKRSFFPGGSYTINEVLEDNLKPLGIPIMKGLPFGHMKGQVIMPIGINSELDTDKKTLSFLEPPVL